MAPKVRILSVPGRRHRLDDEFERGKDRLIDAFQACQRNIVDHSIQKDEQYETNEIIDNESISPGELDLREPL